MKFKHLFAVTCALLVASSLTEAKRSWSSSSSKTKSRPTYSSRPSSSGHSNYDNTKLSYGGNTYSQPKSNPSSNPAPIGWNVPSNNKPQGPPPVYSASNPVGGAKTNPYEKPPPYNPAYSNTNNRATGTGAAAAGAHHGTAYRPKQNSTGGFGSGYHSRNSTGGFGGIQQSHVSNQHSSYPTQQLPAGATYHQSVPAGATYHQSVPAGATYYPGYSQGGYHPAGGVAQYPSGYHPSAGGYAQQPTYFPAGGALPAGATFYNNPNSLPPGATYYSQKPSGPGFGTGLLGGLAGGAALGYLLTPSHTQTVHQAAPVAASDDKDRIIIINNGQPASVTESKDGTTIINTNPAAAPAQSGMAPAQPGMAPAQPGMAQAQPLPGVAPAPQADTGTAPLAPLSPVPGGSEASGSAPLAPLLPAAGSENNQPAPGGEQPPPPPAPGGIICVPVMVNVTSPTDPNNVTQVEQIACYPAPPPEPQPMVNGTAVQPPEQENIPAIPNSALEQEKVSTASLPENSKLQKNGAEKTKIMNIIPSTLFALIIAYCYQN